MDEEIDSMAYLTVNDTLFKAVLSGETQLDYEGSYNFSNARVYSNLN